MGIIPGIFRLKVFSAQTSRKENPEVQIICNQTDRRDKRQLIPATRRVKPNHPTVTGKLMPHKKQLPRWRERFQSSWEEYPPSMRSWKTTMIPLLKGTFEAESHGDSGPWWLEQVSNQTHPRNPRKVLLKYRPKTTRKFSNKIRTPPKKVQ